MKPLVAGLAALAFALSLGWGAQTRPAQADPAGMTVPMHVLPAAPSKTTKPKPKPKPSATPTPTPVVQITTVARTAADEEGERWVLLATVVGAGLLGCVAVFFGLGALLRRRPKPNS